MSRSSGELKTRWRAIVSSTAPRFEPRWPPVFETDSTRNWRISSARRSHSSSERAFRSLGEWMRSRSMCVSGGSADHRRPTRSGYRRGGGTAVRASRRPRPRAPHRAAAPAPGREAAGPYTCPVPVVFVNGALVEEESAVVSVFDHGLVTGDGVFESLLVDHGVPFALDQHLARLEQSAALIGLAPPPRAELEAAVLAVAQRSETPRARLRLTVTAGRGPLASARLEGPPTVVVALSPLTEGLPEPCSVVTVPWPRNEHSALAGAKTISYAENVVALAWAKEHR